MSATAKENEPLNPEAADFVAKAMNSEASTWVDEVLAGEDKGTLESLKKEMFEKVYEAMGDEVAPEDIRRLLVSRNEKFPWWQVYLLNLISCGLFCIFRPRDDESVLVLTKNERVMMYKVERLNTLGNCKEVITTLFNYGIAIFGFWITQQLILTSMGSEYFDAELRKLHEFKTMYENAVEDHAWIQYFIYVAVAIGLMFWVWTKCPHDYGTRGRQSHAANKVCAAQYTLHGGIWRRVARLRLFFGRYPEAGAMEYGMHIKGSRSNPVCAPIPRERLTESGGSLNPFASSAGSLYLTAILLLNCLTFLDAGLTYVATPAQHLIEMEKMKHFCRSKSAFEKACTKTNCERWALKPPPDVSDAAIEDSFCEYVGWFTNAAEAASECEGGQAPCCGGCSSGNFAASAENSFEMFKLMVGFITDIGTLMFAFGAATIALSHTEEKGNIDIKIKRIPRPRFYTSTFHLVQPLANSFCSGIWKAAFEPVQIEPVKDLACIQEPKKPIGAPELRRGKRYDDIDGDDAQGTNFRDLNNYSLEKEYNHWEDFLRGSNCKSVVEKGENKWMPKVNVPTQPLGLLDKEAVIGAWAERPMMTFVMVSPIFLGGLIMWLLLVSLEKEPEEGKLPKWIYFLGQDPVMIVSAISIMVVVLMLLAFVILYVYLYVAMKHAVILTDRRIFYVQFRERCCLLMWYTPQMRCDTFRHDHQITYGGMKTNHPSLYMRCSGVPWTPGKVVIQPGIYGVLEFNRQRGNVLNVYQAVCQLVRMESVVISDDSIKKAGVSWETCKQYVEQNMKMRLGDVWGITNLQPDDQEGMIPDVYMANHKEKPLFFWSFKEFGWVSEATSTNTDVVVTTNRIYKQSRAIFKPYDCRTALCFGACYCTWFKKIFKGKKYLARTSSFIMMENLLSYTTEVSVTPPVWHDPQRLPVKVPCCEVCCNWCTLFWACQTCGAEGCSAGVCTGKDCSVMPIRGAARAQLWMLWRHKFNGVQPDLQARIRPYVLKDRAFITDCFETLGCGSARAEYDQEEIGDPADVAKCEMIRKIMGVVQDAAGFT